MLIEPEKVAAELVALLSGLGFDSRKS